METPTFFSGRDPLTRLRFAGVALVGLLAAGAALAAPCADQDCCNAARDLMAPHDPFGSLSVRDVDLGEPDDAAAEVTVTDSAAPLLYFAPRVASILEDVFGDEQPETDSAAETPPSAPLAGTRDGEEREHYGPLSQAGNAEQLPKFQRQMYRTDI